MDSELGRLVGALPGLLWTARFDSLALRLRRFDGCSRGVVVRASPLADTKGEAVQWCAVSSDPHHRRSARSP